MSQEEPQDTARITARVPFELHRLVRIKALKEGKSLARLVEVWAERYVSDEPKNPAAGA